MLNSISVTIVLLPNQIRFFEVSDNKATSIITLSFLELRVAGKY